MLNVLYREGDCWSSVELEEFSMSAISNQLGYAAEEVDPLGHEELTVEHVDSPAMTIITYFDEEGESRNWIAPTVMFVE
jgi:hypothetical protein